VLRDAVPTRDVMLSRVAVFRSHCAIEYEMVARPPTYPMALSLSERLHASMRSRVGIA
jgi:hypothetical protein